MFGGVQAVTWTDVKTMTLIVVGFFVIIVTAVLGLPEGVSLGDGLAVAAATDRLRSFDFSFDLSNQYTFWSGTIAALFLFCSYFGADQSQVQRYLTARSLPEARQSLLMSAYWKIPLQVIVLLAGVLVFVFYTFNQGPLIFSAAAEARLRSGQAAVAYRALESEFDAAFTARRQAAVELAGARASADAARVSAARSEMRSRESAMQGVRARATRLLRETEGDTSFTDVNYIIPTFILTQLPIGLIGLLIVGILMAATDTIAAELNSLSTATVIDFYKRRMRPTATDAHYLTVSKIATGSGGCSRAASLSGQPSWLAHRGGQSLRIVLLRIDPRCVYPRCGLSPRHLERRVRRPHRGDGISGMGSDVHQRRVSLAQRDRRRRRRRRRPGCQRGRSGPEDGGRHDTVESERAVGAVPAFPIDMWIRGRAVAAAFVGGLIALALTIPVSRYSLTEKGAQGAGFPENATTTARATPDDEPLHEDSRTVLVRERADAIARAHVWRAPKTPIARAHLGRTRRRPQSSSAGSGSATSEAPHRSSTACSIRARSCASSTARVRKSLVKRPRRDC